MADRIHSIDAVRGFCLLNIFVNHVTLGQIGAISPSHIGFFDSADVFVFLAGVSTMLAYGALKRGVLAGMERMWSRAATIYLANLAVIAVSLAISLPADLAFPPRRPEFSPATLIAEHGWLTFAWHALTMQQSVGYSMVLRLYVFLMAMAPALVWLATKRWWLPLVPALLVWVAPAISESPSAIR